MKTCTIHLKSFLRKCFRDTERAEVKLEIKHFLQEYNTNEL